MRAIDHCRASRYDAYWDGLAVTIVATVPSNSCPHTVPGYAVCFDPVPGTQPCPPVLIFSHIPPYPALPGMLKDCRVAFSLPCVNAVTEVYIYDKDYPYVPGDPTRLPRTIPVIPVPGPLPVT